MRAKGKIGTRARHHLNGNRRALNPNIAVDIIDYFPTNTTEYSRRIALRSFKISLNGSN